MIKLRKIASAAIVMGAVLAALSGCGKKEGPAEKAGKEADKAVEQVGQKIEKAGEDLQDAAKGNKK
jgi:predicted small lipoprotein YifL